MTALAHMAAARPPGIADARVPCPLCGGLIHPVAGRCKHCKEDLTSFRAGRPQAATALPALNGKPATANGSNGHVVATAIPVAMPVTQQDGSQPILPPRTTARSVPVPRIQSMWRSWPMLVIILAVVAIVAATVIMVMPQSTKKNDGKMSAPPAPERMETNPMPDKQSQLDPWNSAPGGVPRTPDPVPPPPDPDDDLWGSGGGGVTGGGAFGTHGANFMITALEHACTKLKSCPDVDQSTLSSVCEAVSMMPKQPPMTGCAAAERCLNAIDHLSCSQASQASPHSVFTMFDDCTRAATQC
jgi:hypothetical protein